MAKMRLKPWLSGAIGVTLLGSTLYKASGVVLEERERSLASTMPHSSAHLAESNELVDTNSRFRGIVLRLTDELGKAEIVAPKMVEHGVVGLLGEHWRRHLCPFAGPGGERGRYVQSVSLTLRNGESNAPDITTNNAKKGDADQSVLSSLRNTQTFGLGEGSFAERESILLPPPGRIRYRVNLPKSSVLRFSPAVLGDGDVTFIVRFLARGEQNWKPLFSKTVKGPSKRWTSLQIDLSNAEGDGQLELATEGRANETTIGLWGSPVVLAPAATKVPYNVLFVIVDAMRGDAIAASHDRETDAKRENAKYSSYDACFAAMPEVSPAINDLAAKGVVWQNAWSAAMWTRPSTVAMLSGERSSRLGLSVMNLELMPAERRRFYVSRPPMLPKYFRDAGAETTAIVNNMYLSGSVGVGVDYAFEALIDHRYSTLDTRYITEDALSYLDEHHDERFFLLLNYASPHAPYSPSKSDLKAIEKAQNLPKNRTVRNYLGEIHKDDAAIGEVLKKVEALGLTEKTLIIVTADHGETMSEAHDVVAVDVAKGAPSGRFTHLSMMWEEASHIAMVMSLPGKLPKGMLAKQWVQNVDIFPTVLELEGMKVPEGLDGRSLVPTFSGKTLEERPIVVEGRGARAIQVGKYRLVVRERVARRLRVGKNGKEFEKTFELYDHEQDPGERKDLAHELPAVVERLRRELIERVSSPTAGRSTGAKAKYHLRFALGGKSGSIEAHLFARGKGAASSKLEVTSDDIDARAIHKDSRGVIVAFEETPTSVPELVVELHGDDVELGWEIRLNGDAWPKDRFFGGELGMRLAEASDGIKATIEPKTVEGAMSPHIVGETEFGVFVTREPVDGPAEIEPSAQAQLEAEQAMQAWGYARKTTKKAP